MSDRMKCPKCGYTSGDDWRQCGGSCPMPGSPHFREPDAIDAIILSVRHNGRSSDDMGYLRDIVRAAMPRWVRVDERVPTVHCAVWVSNWEGVIEGIWSEVDEEFLRYDVHGAYESIDNPKHWMPRATPEAPKD